MWNKLPLITGYLKHLILKFILVKTSENYWKCLYKFQLYKLILSTFQAISWKGSISMAFREWESIKILHPFNGSGHIQSPRITIQLYNLTPIYHLLWKARGVLSLSQAPTYGLDADIRSPWSKSTMHLLQYYNVSLQCTFRAWNNHLHFSQVLSTNRNSYWQKEHKIYFTLNESYEQLCCINMLNKKS